jgi:galactokinase
MRIFRAPGRVNLIGEHTDYSGGLVLPVAIDRTVRIFGDPGGDQILLDSDAFEGMATVAADGSDLDKARDWGRYVAAVAAELADLGRPAVGFRGRVSSDLPAGAGLSSSAALEVALATMLAAVADFTLEPLALAQAGQRAEYRAVGVPCGIMDQAASVLGRRNHAVLLDCTTLEHRLVPLPAELALVVIDSGVRRRLESSGYAQRRGELEEALKVLEGRRPSQTTPEEAAALAERAGLDDLLARRLRHVVSENARVLATEAALTKPGAADVPALGRLFADSHASLRDDYEVSTRELDLLVELAVEAGAVGARMTGAGFGGAIVALAERESATRLGAAVAERYGGLSGGRQAAVHVCEAADGAGEVTPS